MKYNKSSIYSRIEQLLERVERKRNASQSVEQRVIQTALYYYYYRLTGEDVPLTPMEKRVQKYHEVYEKMASIETKSGYLHNEIAELFDEMKAAYECSPETFRIFLERHKVLEARETYK